MQFRETFRARVRALVAISGTGPGSQNVLRFRILRDRPCGALGQRIRPFRMMDAGKVSSRLHGSGFKAEGFRRQCRA